MDMQKASIERLLTTIIGNPLTASHVVQVLEAKSLIPSREELIRIVGVGPKTADKILAICELSGRFFVGTKAMEVTNHVDVARRLAFLKYEPQEKTCLMTLDAHQHVINVHEIAKGTATSTPFYPRDVFKMAILDNAVTIILAHNHPSGNNEPSSEDYAITRNLCNAGKVLMIPVVDHIIISKTGYTSMCVMNPELFEITINNY